MQSKDKFTFIEACNITRAREYERKGEYVKAEILTKACAFEALQNKDVELLHNAYKLLSDLEDDEYLMFSYLQGAYATSKIDSGVYMQSCNNIIRKMHRMDTPQVMRFIEFMVSAVDGIFSEFLVALYSRLTGAQAETYNLPSNLKEELYRFNVKK